MNSKIRHKLILHSRKNVLRDGGTKTNFVKGSKIEVEHEDEMASTKVAKFCQYQTEI
jgi:hypothetical protein